MANELSLKVELHYYTAGNPPVDVKTNTKYITVTGRETNDNVYSIGFAAKENIAAGDIGTFGYVYIENLDGTNFVEFGDDADAPTGKLLAGEFALLRWGATNLSILADTAAVRVRVVAIET